MSLKLNVNEGKIIEFDINIQGTTSSRLKGHMRFIIEGIEYGIPADIINNVVKVDIPPLEDIIKTPLIEGQKIETKLELIVDDNYMKPWQDTVIIEKPITIEAKIKGVIKSVSEDKKPKISISKINEKKSKTASKKKKTITKLSKVFSGE